MIEVVFENKTSEKKTTLKLDSCNNRQETCTISQIIGDGTDFVTIAPFKEGCVTTVGEIREFAEREKATFDCTAFDGNNGGVSIEDYYNPTEEEEGDSVDSNDEIES